MQIKTNNYATYHNLQLIKFNLISTYADYLRFNKQASEKYPTQADKVNAFDVFKIDIAPIKNLVTLQKMRKRYAK